MNASSLSQGMIIANKYILEREIGRGGYGAVWLARAHPLGMAVALKMLRPDHDEAGDSATLARFEREALLLARLKAPTTVRIHDYGEEAGFVFIALEFVEGEQLAKLPVPLDPRRAITIVRQVLESLQEAHALGILHRDLKPQNIMIMSGGADHIKVLDFGIARVMGSGQDLTRTGTIVGTPRYVSPEQLREQDVGPWSDLYSLGIVTHELLSGARLIPLESDMALLAWHISSAPAPPLSEQPAPLASFVARLLEKDHRLRYQSAAEALEGLRQVTEALQAPAPLPITLIPLTPPTPAPAHVPAPAPPPSAWRQRAPLLAMIALAALAVGVSSLRPAPPTAAPQAAAPPPAAAPKAPPKQPAAPPPEQPADLTAAHEAAADALHTSIPAPPAPAPERPPARPSERTSERPNKPRVISDVPIGGREGPLRQKTVEVEGPLL